jgi:hypothetical protein
MKIYLTLLGSAALVLGLTAASRVSPDPVAGACGLITREEAAAALGAAVPAGTENAMDVPMLAATVKTQYCFYGSEVVVARMELGGGAASLFGKYRHSLASESGYQNVTGVGDEAFAAKGQLAMRKGTVGVIIDVGQNRGGGPKELQAEKALAVLALGRI